ncbi:hypothetical protein ACFXKD_25755 [Nocardiopsis aegyptia]|uniref:hypothetical protein n=1 Tax=Nocardiopsis aegyptia TaxID=220378 RepID=UPI003671AD12
MRIRRLVTAIAAAAALAGLAVPPAQAGPDLPGTVTTATPPWVTPGPPCHEDGCSGHWLK